MPTAWKHAANNDICAETTFNHNDNITFNSLPFYLPIIINHRF